MTRPIRVGIDVTPLLGPASGIHQVTRNLIVALTARDDIDVRGWTLSARGPRPDISIPVRRSRFPAGLAQRLWATSRFPPPRLIAGKVDIVHGTNFMVPPSASSIVSVQDLTPVTHPEWVRPEVAASAKPLRRAIASGAVVHASSQAMADEIEAELGVESSKIAVVHHGIPPVLDAPAGRIESLTGGGRFVLALGTVERRKNIPALAALVPTFPPDVKLVIAGPEGNDEDALNESLQRNGASSRTTRLTHVDDLDRAALLRGASVVAFPSWYEGFGLPPLEAIGVGTEVVATAVGALPELVGDSVDLVAPGDMVAFGERLIAALDTDPLGSRSPDPQLQARISALTWQRAAAEMIAVYHSML